MSQKTLIVWGAVFFLVSAGFLFWKNNSELDPDAGKNWWVISFVHPEDPGDLSFSIENHSTKREFRYQVFTQDGTLTQGSVELETGSQESIMVIERASTATRTRVLVETGPEKKEIYRSVLP
ncbi:MAG: hypothetical protein ABI747_02625 [Candidatus Moraniibacteriota bacterium]